MPNIALHGDSLSAPNFSVPTVTSSQGFVTINGVAVVMQGNSVSSHSHNSTSEVHNGATMQTSQAFVTINGVPIVMDGDSATCSSTHTVIGTGFVTIGGN